MSILCHLFGHKPLTDAGYSRGVGYARVGANSVDGINCWHLSLKAECPRCGKIYRICNVHVPSNTPPGWPLKRTPMTTQNIDPMEAVPGHRVQCTPEGYFPPYWTKPGAYGRLNRSLEQVWNCEAQLWWNVCAPDGSSCILNPSIHTVTEHADGTITVSPSIITTTWHGWLQSGVWRSV